MYAVSPAGKPQSDGLVHCAEEVEEEDEPPLDTEVLELAVEDGTEDVRGEDDEADEELTGPEEVDPAEDDIGFELVLEVAEEGEEAGEDVEDDGGQVHP